MLHGVYLRVTNFLGLLYLSIIATHKSGLASTGFWMIEADPVFYDMGLKLHCGSIVSFQSTHDQ